MTDSPEIRFADDCGTCSYRRDWASLAAGIARLEAIVKAESDARAGHELRVDRAFDKLEKRLDAFEGRAATAGTITGTLAGLLTAASAYLAKHWTGT